MGRKPAYKPLKVLLNNRMVGTLFKAKSGSVSFTYDAEWLDWPHRFAISLSLPLRPDAYTGEVVTAVFENLLPDSELLRRQVAERVGARGTDAYSLLTQIGRDCVGALQFWPDTDLPPSDTTRINGSALSEEQIERLLNGLARVPLGVSTEQDFRISVAGAQEKTALLRHDGVWKQPHGTTPTTHILKPAIGHLPGGIDLTTSVENEYYCLTLLEKLGFHVPAVEIQHFGERTALVIERFDRRHTKDGRLLRLPQEDFCQALSVPPTLKYQAEGGPGLVQMLRLLKGSDTPREDQLTLIKAQLVFWLMAATDGHAKNFSVFLSPGGGFRLTPIYDVLSAQPSVDARMIERKQLKLALSLGRSNHYRFDRINARHFKETLRAATLPEALFVEALEQVANALEAALTNQETTLPRQFPGEIHESISRNMKSRLAVLLASSNTQSF
ncbi:type II toxin-antitoxin system HipA family toxin [Pseudovibrio sp. SPO723]|uniref:type II toxin-antitoxin system HipA family toxin n=1 Tax=Nesiotobacter zosterae TaxID=392721 RepID=UPI0029C1302F|nr:type II toxin-antitoxin system HipA family toxin [Pseudovibrio sp. SPO723]MDX5594385.1 type II toxin-antitoxin system HipA family toxin [Pseudovibrio sp. SPO723]